MTELIFNIDLTGIIGLIGYLGLFAVVFAESGLFFGFFLPGDSLLFAAGLMASQDYFNIGVLVAVLAVAAITGDNVGYWFGKKVGPRLFVRDDSLFFKKRHVERTRRFYEKYGPRAVVLARFIPIVRTFTPILAGVGQMHYGTFLRYNILGGLIWSVGVTSLGYFLGNTLPNAEEFLLPIVVAIILLSFVPMIPEFFKKKEVGLPADAPPVPQEK